MRLRGFPLSGSKFIMTRTMRAWRGQTDKAIYWLSRTQTLLHSRLLCLRLGWTARERRRMRQHGSHAFPRPTPRHRRVEGLLNVSAKSPASMKVDGRDAERAEAVRDAFERTLAIFEEHLRSMMQDPGSPDSERNFCMFGWECGTVWAGSPVPVGFSFFQAIETLGW